MAKQINFTVGLFRLSNVTVRALPPSEGKSLYVFHAASGACLKLSNFFVIRNKACRRDGIISAVEVFVPDAGV